MIDLTDEQREKIAQRLTLHTDPTDRGHTLERTARALAMPADTRAEQAARLEHVVHSLSVERVIVPVVLHSDRADTNIEFTAVTTSAGRALALFTSTQELAAYDPQARPLPVSTRLAALSALVETRGLMVVDPAGSQILIPRPASTALSVGDTWLPAWKDSELAARLRQCVIDEAVPSVIDVKIHFGGGTRVIVELCTVAGGDEQTLRRDLSRVIHRMNSNERLKTAADEIVITPTWAPLA